MLRCEFSAQEAAAQIVEIEISQGHKSLHTTRKLTLELTAECYHKSISAVSALGGDLITFKGHGFHMGPYEYAAVLSASDGSTDNMQCKLTTRDELDCTTPRWKWESGTVKVRLFARPDDLTGNLENPTAWPAEIEFRSGLDLDLLQVRPAYLDVTTPFQSVTGTSSVVTIVGAGFNAKAHY